MKNIFKILLICLAGLLCLRLIIGIVFHKQLQPDVFTVEDLPPLDLSAENGYFKIWALNEPLDVNINDPKVIAKYQKLFDHTQTSKETLQHWYNKEYKEMGCPDCFKKNVIGKTLNRSIMDQDYDSWFKNLIKNKHLIVKFARSNPIRMKRYNDIILSTSISEISFPDIEINSKLFTLIVLSKVYSKLNLLKSIEGQWLEGTAALIDQLNCGRQLCRSSRDIPSAVLHKSMIDKSLIALWIIVNHPKCPEEVFSRITDTLSLPLQYKELLPREVYVGAYLQEISSVEEDLISDYKKSFVMKIGLNIFLDFTEMKRNIYKKYSDFANFNGDMSFKEMQSRFDSDLHFVLEPSISTIFILLFDNGMGKRFEELTISSPNFQVFHTYKSMFFYDRVVLLSQFFLNHKPGESDEETIQSLNYSRKIDPFTLEPYGWDKEKRIFFSIYLQAQIEKEETEHKQREAEEKSIRKKIQKRNPEKRGDGKGRMSETDKKKQLPYFRLYFKSFAELFNNPVIILPTLISVGMGICLLFLFILELWVLSLVNGSTNLFQLFLPVTIINCAIMICFVCIDILLIVFIVAFPEGMRIGMLMELIDTGKISKRDLIHNGKKYFSNYSKLIFLYGTLGLIISSFMMHSFFSLDDFGTDTFFSSMIFFFILFSLLAIFFLYVKPLVAQKNDSNNFKSILKIILLYPIKHPLRVIFTWILASGIYELVIFVAELFLEGINNDIIQILLFLMGIVIEVLIFHAMDIFVFQVYFTHQKLKREEVKDK